MKNNVTLCHLYRNRLSGQLVVIIINLACSSIYTHDGEREIDDRMRGTTEQLTHTEVYRTVQYN